MANEIKRGQIYWVDWNPARGSEQSGLRPALVIQNDIGNRFSPTTIVAAITTASERHFPFLIQILAQESGLSKDSAVNLSVILTVDKAWLGSRCGELKKAKMLQIDEAIRSSLGT